MVKTLNYCVHESTWKVKKYSNFVVWLPTVVQMTENGFYFLQFQTEKSTLECNLHLQMWLSCCSKGWDEMTDDYFYVSGICMVSQVHLSILHQT